MAQGGLLFLGTDLADLGMQVFVGGTWSGRHHQILQSGNLPLENFNLKSKGGQQFYNCGVNLHAHFLSRKDRQQSYNCDVNLHTLPLQERQTTILQLWH